MWANGGDSNIGVRFQRQLLAETAHHLPHETNITNLQTRLEDETITWFRNRDRTVRETIV